MRAVSNPGAETARAAPAGELTRPKEGADPVPSSEYGEETAWEKPKTFLAALLRALSPWPT
jgi:hypothetical protein